MTARLTISALAAFGLWLAPRTCGAQGGEPKDVPDDRAKVVRLTYEKVPPTVLGIKEPVRMTQCSEGKVPVTYVVIVVDADEVYHYFTWWLDKGKFQNAEEFDRIYWLYHKGIGGKRTGKFRLAVRGPEEDAFYGLLLRWAAARVKEKDPSPFDKLMLQEANKLLGKLDERFAAEKPVLLK